MKLRVGKKYWVRVGLLGSRLRARRFKCVAVHPEGASGVFRGWFCYRWFATADVIAEV